MRLNGWHVPVEWLSASALSTFIACPELYRLQKIKKIKESMGLSRFTGIVDHSATAANLSQKIETHQDITTEELMKVFAREWDLTIEQEGEPEWGLDEQDAALEKGLEMVSLYHETISPMIQPIKVEQRFEEKVKGLPVPIVGYPDVEEKGLIIERKTSSKKMNKPKPGWTFQGNIYSLVLDKPVAYHCVTNQVTPQITTPLTSPDLMLENSNHDATVRLLQHAAYMLNDTYIRLGEDRPWATLGVLHDWRCNFCFAGPKYANSCVAWNPESPYLNGGSS